MINRNELTDEELYQGLFQFIKKNKAIPEFLAQIHPDKPQLTALTRAIEAGDCYADIFTDEHTQLYLLYLIKENKIPFWQGMTVYIYLIALMQFTDKLSLKKEDISYQSPKEIRIAKLSIDGTLTEEGEKYINDICLRLSHLDIYINKQELIEFCLALPATEQWLMKIPTHQNEYEIDDIIRIVAINLPIVGSRTEALAFYDIPSASLIKYLLHAVSPDALQIQPIFGRISSDTLLRLHSQGIHPLPLYSLSVKSNIMKVHGHACGPFAAWLHDLGHTFWGSLLSQTERNHLFNNLIPQVQEWSMLAKLHQDIPLKEYCSKIIAKLADFNLTPLINFMSPSTRFMNYLFSSFDRGKSDTTDVLLDKIIFMFATAYYNNSWSETEKQLWMDIITKQLMHSSNYNNKSITMLKILTHLAKHLAGSLEDIPWGQGKDNYLGKVMKCELDKIKTHPINWKNIDEIVSKAPSLKMLWSVMKAMRLPELTALIIDCKVDFFPPYIILNNYEVDNEKIRSAFRRQAYNHHWTRLGIFTQTSGNSLTPNVLDKISRYYFELSCKATPTVAHISSP